MIMTIFEFSLIDKSFEFKPSASSALWAIVLESDKPSFEQLWTTIMPATVLQQQQQVHPRLVLSTDKSLYLMGL
jgi:hypothetical protein